MYAMMMDDELIETARYVLEAFRKAGMRIVTAESCTGGMVAALLTEIAGSSDVFERGFVTYSNEAKADSLGVPAQLIADKGAVSAEVAIAMAQGALSHSRADVAVSITGIAGPGGGSAEKPVGLVFVAIAAPDGTYVEELRLGDEGRGMIRRATALAALEMLVAFGLDEEPEESGDPMSPPGDGRLN